MDFLRRFQICDYNETRKTTGPQAFHSEFEVHVSEPARPEAADAVLNNCDTSAATYDVNKLLERIESPVMLCRDRAEQSFRKRAQFRKKHTFK